MPAFLREIHKSQQVSSAFYYFEGFKVGDEYSELDRKCPHSRRRERQTKNPAVEAGK